MADSEDFIQKFHSLEGITLREKKKSFYLLLKSIAPSSTTLDEIIQRLKPITYLEEIFKLDLLIHFKRKIDILNILIEGVEIGAHKIVRQNWFVRQLMQTYTPTQFVEELVPRLSFSIRSKLFKKILVNMEDVNAIEEIFEKILSLYGISTAQLFLPGCSKERIYEIFNNFSIKFSATQLKSLFQKDKDIILEYFNVLTKNGFDVDVHKWRSFFIYIGKEDPVFYFKLCEKFHINKLKLGRKSTKKYVDIERDKIVNKPCDYYRFLRRDALVRKLGNDFPIFYKNLFPQNFYQFHFNYNRSFIKYYPKKRQYKLYFDTFENVYKKSLWDYVEYMDENLIELIYDKAEREKWISKYEKRQNIKKYMLKKRKCAIFFREDNEEIVIKDKKTIFNTLISTCKLMKDYDAFSNILKSFCERHRNSDVTIIYNFLKTIHKQLDLSKFKDEHWQYIYYIIKIQLFKKQQIFHPIFVEYIQFLCINQKPIDYHVLTLLNEAPLTLSKFKYNNKNFRKSMLLLFLQLLPEVTKRQNEIAVQIALSIMKWNEEYPLELICFSEQKNILTAIRELDSAEKINKNTMKVLKSLICTQKTNIQIISNFDNIYWSNYKKLNDSTITKWFIKYKPTVFKEHINKIGVMLKNGNVNLVHDLKKYSHLEIPNAIVTLCLEELKISEPSKCAQLIYILVLFMEIDDLCMLMQQYVPQVDRIDVDNCDEITQKSYAIQQALARYSKLSNNITMILPILLNYCRGDVLSSSLPSLYSSFHRIPENQLYSVLKQLENKAVSVRKHAIFLTSLILPVEQILSKYEQVQSSEKNLSVKQHMFMSCHKFFVRNNTPECWIILKNYLNELKKHQKDVLKMITKVHLIPVCYRAEYTELVWNILEKYKMQNENIDDNMFALLNNLTIKDVPQLNIEFCFNIIENKLFDSVKFSIDDNVFDFATRFLLYGENGERKANLLCKIFSELKENTSKDVEKRNETLCMLYKVTLRLVKDILTTKTENVNQHFLKFFLDALLKIFSVEEIFEETMLLELVQFKIENVGIEELLPGYISNSFTSVVEKYGNLILKRFNNFLRIILDILYVDDEFGLVNFLIYFLDENSSLDHFIAVIDLLPHVSYMSTDDRTKNSYEQLLKKLGDQDRIVRICLCRKLKDM